EQLTGMPRDLDHHSADLVPRPGPISQVVLVRGIFAPYLRPDLGILVNSAQVYQLPAVTAGCDRGPFASRPNSKCAGKRSLPPLVLSTEVTRVIRATCVGPTRRCYLLRAL